MKEETTKTMFMIYFILQLSVLACLASKYYPL